ncbi:MAG: serine/threonine protein kinase [Lachnospiraceae bacterium]|nr:serine/threonine protein kinase [Lachnospiraceae bacterium]
MDYQTIYTIKESEKATVMLAALEGHIGPIVIKKLLGASPDIYRLLCCAQNSHIPQVFAYEQQGNELIVAEEYVDGENLKDYIKKNQLSDKEKLELALQLCEAVEFLHSMEPSMIHRDIKPSNILITGKGVLKLIDFDASRQYKDSRSAEDTRLLGTKGYAPPEQFGYSQTDVRSDIYSMGVVFHGIRPADNTKLAEQWDKIVEKCTSFDPKNRYQCVKELAAEIKKIENRKEVLGRKMATWCIVALVVIGICGTIAFRLWNKQEREAGGELVGSTVTPMLTEELTPALSSSPTATLEPTATPEPSPTPSLVLPEAEYHYYLSFLQDLAVSVGGYQEYEVLDYATAYCLQTGETVSIPIDYLEQRQGYILVSELFLMALDTGTYKFSFHYKGVYFGTNVYEATVEIHSGKVESSEKKLVRSEQTIYSECPGIITNMIRNGDMCKIKRAYFLNQNGEEVLLQNWQWTDFYSWAIVVRGDRLLPYFSQGMLKLYFALDNGTTEEMDIKLIEGAPPISTYSPSISGIQRGAQKYYLSYSENADMIFNHNMEKLDLTSAQCYCNTTGQVLEIPLDMVETGVGYICVSREYMKTLEPLVYKFIFDDASGTKLDSWVLVKQESEIVIKDTWTERIGSLSVEFYSFMPGVEGVLLQGYPGRYAGVLLKQADGTEVALEPELYNIACDGRYILVKKEFFMQYSIGEKITLIFTFDDGGRQQEEITMSER